MLNYLEKNYGVPENPLKAGSEIPKVIVTLPGNKELDIDTLLANGPVLLNFIRGTWCMFCRAHMGNLAKWQEATKKNVSVLIISNESPEVIQDWKEKSYDTHLMGSDESQKVINSFGLGLTEAEFARPATFLIDSNRIIRMAHYEKRTPTMLKEFSIHLEAMREKAKKESMGIE